MREMTIFTLLISLFFTLTGCDNTEGGDGSDDADIAGDAEHDSDAGSDSDVEVEEPLPWPDSRYLSPEAVHQRLLAGDTDMLLLNVVDEEFYNLGCIDGSIIIPWDLLDGRLDEVDSLRHIVIYCRLGVRSESAYSTLESHGYERLWIMEGGISAWSDLGFATVDI